ncbi:radical SAM family heme chaperone HemW [Tissierella sp. Yu-01]|uniref:radical SAM family heme chaperone HemW n=1 Tax=Tissierella sp. Yu-01 TaxID=3035694 RepID=UPI00240DDFAF|nr:radical SAM family heme chaperone HemW [Tissierella sp. Yu-01]WFA09535.1 radical SAM family heme chaperone HemW [Tissierella sp. Yu-01]
MKTFSLYIHIPFCERKCYYCDFTSFAKNDEVIDEYVININKEISLYKERLCDYKLETIFIGGGTPSSIEPVYIEKILENVYDTFDVQYLNEITIEANPGTLNSKKVKSYKNIGINRVSLGLQTLNNSMLKSIGRIHTANDFIESFFMLRNEGFANINVDLMLGLPGQKQDDLKATLNEIIRLNLEHISLYSLIIEEGTLINKWYKKGLLYLPDEDLERHMYHDSIRFLKEYGYEHYEISNFAKPGYECKHNLTYWKIKPYLGIGLNSHSNLAGKRFWNHSKFADYNNRLKNNLLPIEGEEIIDKNMEIAEFCIMGLRLINGINKLEYKNRFGEDIKYRYDKIINKHVHNGLIKEDYNHIRLTSKGLDLSNMVEVDFMP